MIDGDPDGFELMAAAFGRAQAPAGWRDDAPGGAAPFALWQGQLWADAAFCGGWLEAEFAPLALALPLAGIELLVACGVPPGVAAALHARGALGRGWCRERAGRWEPAALREVGCNPRLLIAVREQGVLVDVAALSPTAPDEWALRTGDGQLLGADLLREAEVHGAAAPLRVFATPLAWLRGDCAGICVLRWQADIVARLRALGPGAVLLADDRASAEALDEVLRWQGLPRVDVFESELGRMVA